MNAFLLNTINLGDLCSAPSRYFPELGPPVCVSKIKPDSLAPLIFGGGGMFYPDIAGWMKRLVSRHRGPTVLWGIGSNTHGLVHAPYPDWLGSVSLIGLRDSGSGHRWVPCASCLDPAFDIWRPSKPSFPAVAYLHHEMGHPREFGPELPVCKNDAVEMDQALKFLSMGEVIVTNTYHGVYWGTLLGRKVIAYPFSTKFFSFRHPPVLVIPGHSWTSGIAFAKAYPNSLEECRHANYEFFRDVKSIL